LLRGDHVKNKHILMCEITDKNFSIFSGAQKTFDNEISIKINERLIKNKTFHLVFKITQ